jgi:proline-specific peptidase
MITGNTDSTTAVPVIEGFVPFRGYRTWYEIVGSGDDSGKLPVLALHGGPGAAHDYLEPLGALAATGRRVIFYDQLGCGKSDQPHNPSLWTVDLYKDELAALRSTLGLDRVHLFGSSWGGMLAMEYALTQPSGLASLIIASSPASMRQWVDEANLLREALPADVQATLVKHEAAGSTDDPEYQEAMMVFYRRHVCRTDPWPDCVLRTFAQLERNPEVYYTMNGPSEFHVTGTIKDWNIVDRLDEIRVPTLVTAGEFDEATPAIAKRVHDGIRGSELVTFKDCSHMTFVEKPAEYIQVLDDFLSRVEGAEL